MDDFEPFEPFEETIQATPAASAAIVRELLIRYEIDRRFNDAIERIEAR
jgi:hypothetical protein